MCVSLAINQRLGASAHHAERHESADEIDRRRQVNLLPLRPGNAPLDGAFLGAKDDPIKIALESRRRPGHVGSRDVRHVAFDLRTGIDEDEFTVAHQAGRWCGVQDRRIRTAADNRAVARAGGAVTEELRLELDLERAFADARPQFAAEAREAVGGRGGGATDQGEFIGVLLPSDLGERLADVPDSGGGGSEFAPWRAEVYHAPAGPGRQPLRKTLDRGAVPLRAALPVTLALGHLWHERNPARNGPVVRIEGEHASDRLLAGQVEILGVRPKWVRLIASFGQRNRSARSHHEQRIMEWQGGGDAGPAGFETVTHRRLDRGAAKTGRQGKMCAGKTHLFRSIGKVLSPSAVAGANSMSDGDRHDDFEPDSLGTRTPPAAD
jgi:hypothetical protein